jgi:tetratricopeptide (TPR) repeat protein
MHPAVLQSRALVSAFKHDEAEQLLLRALVDTPDHPDLNAELGLLYCYIQKEFEATERLNAARGAERYDQLVQTLADYFHCRAQLAQKFGVNDEKSLKYRELLAQHQPGPVSEHAGITLSACLIVKNEEQHLGRCLESIKDVVDEIVVVDTGSTDRTVEIAESFGAKIGHFEWRDDFAAARNESLRLASGHWALWIDADEELAKESHNTIREALIRPQFGGFFIQIVNFMDEEGDANRYVHTPVRLFRRLPGVEFEGRIHEQILPSFQRLGIVPATLVNATIYHYGYRASTMAEKDKLNRTVSMLEKEVRENPTDPFHWFNLANAYSVGGRSADAERAAKVSTAYIEPTAPYAPVVFQILTSALIAQEKLEEALQVCDDADFRGCGGILNDFDRAHALLKLERFEEALKAIDRCLTSEWPHDLTGDYGIMTYKGQTLKAQVLTGLDRHDEAAALLQDALAQAPDFPIALYAQAALLEKTGQPQAAIDFYVKASAAPGMAACLKFAGRSAAQIGNFDLASQLYERFWKEHPNDPEGCDGWIAAAEAAGDHPRLLQAYESVFSQIEPDPALLINWGRALAASGMFEAALQRFTRAIELAPQEANGYFNCGDTLYLMGEYVAAAEVYQSGLRHEPMNGQGWFVLGNCLAQLNVLSAAKIAYEQALALIPGHPEALANLETISAEAEASAA